MQPYEIQLASSFAIILLTCSRVNLVRHLNQLLFKIVCHVKVTVITVVNLLRHRLKSDRYSIFQTVLGGRLAREKQLNLQLI